MRKSLGYFRIIWTVFCGFVCLLLIVLWARSYSNGDAISVPAGITVFSTHGTLLAMGNSASMISRDDNTSSWSHESPRFVTSKPSQLMPVETRTGFYAHFWSRTFWVAQAPIWFLVMFAVTVATLPWIRQLRWRFTLRTLLIATTLVAVVLGLIVWLSR
jgi:hypothetical protein